MVKFFTGLQIAPNDVSVADPVFETEDLQHLRSCGYAASTSSDRLLDASDEVSKISTALGNSP